MGDTNTGPPPDLCQLPSGIPPGDVRPNFTDPEILGPTVIGVGVALGTVSLVLVIIRTYHNWRRMHIADWFTLISMGLYIAFIGVICAQHRNFRHSWDTPACWNTGNTLKMVFVQTILFSPAFFFPKAAIFLLYRQLFAVNRKPRLVVDAGITLTLLCYLSNIPMAAIYGAPRVGQTWESMLLTYAEDARPLSVAGVVQSAVGTFIDLYIFVLPIPFLLSLQMPKRRVLGLIGVFSTALLGVGASIMSLVFKIQVINDTNDGSYLGALASLGSLIEVGIAIIVGCMPAVASFSTNVIGDSRLFVSLRSYFTTNATRTGGSGSGGGRSKQTISSSGTREHEDRRDQYHKLGNPRKRRADDEQELTTFGDNPRDDGPVIDSRW